MGSAEVSRVPAGQPKWFGWDEITAAAPQMTATMWRYLDQAATFLAPASVVSAEGALRQLAWFLINNTDVRTVAGISRSDIEELKLVAGRPAWCQRRHLVGEHPTPETADAAHVLRADHRMGLGRRPTPQPHHQPRHPTETRTAAEVLRRPRRSQAHDRGSKRHRSQRPARPRGARPHRTARRGALRPRSRRGCPDRRRLLAARSARQAPQRPIRAPAPPARRTARRMDRHAP